MSRGSPIKLTKTVVDRLAIPAALSGRKGQAFYRDVTLKGFAVRVTSGGTKTFVVEKRVNGRVRRMTLGRYGELTVEQARTEAQKLLGKIAMGVDPIAEKRNAQVRAISLGDTFNDYLTARKALKPRTVYDYQRAMKQYFGDWLNKPIIKITKEMVETKHTKLGKAHGGAQANQGMRTLRAVLNFAARKYEDADGRSLLAQNPVNRLSHIRAWYRVDRRQTVIKAHDLPAWYRAVMALQVNHVFSKAEVARDYFLLLLFTGLRRQEATRLRWDRVDLKGRTLTVTDTKNHQDHTLPLSDFLYDLLDERKKMTESDYVFPGDGKTGHLVEPRKQMLKVTKESGVSFTLHDLRRTFITVAESLDIPAYALKRLLNHKMTNDVTAGYIVANTERLRKPMQMITDYLLSVGDVRQQADVIKLENEDRYGGESGETHKVHC